MSTKTYSTADYSKDHSIESQVQATAWYQWLRANAVSGVDYQLIYVEDAVEINWINAETALAFQGAGL
jgi:hypothetical protein